MKISDREKKMLIFLAGLIVCVAVYFNVYLVYMAKTEQLEQENSILNSRVEELKAIRNNIADYENKTIEMNQKIVSYNQAFPADIKEEDAILLLKELEDKTSVQIVDFSVSEKTEVMLSQDELNGETASDSEEDSMNSDTDNSEQAASIENNLTEQDGAQTSSDLKLVVIPATVNYKCSYEGLKELIEFTRNHKTKISIETLTSSFDSESGHLGGSFLLNVYALEGKGREYVTPNIDSINIGTDNIFKSINETSSKTNNDTEKNNKNKKQKETKKTSDEDESAERDE